jgi:hypothetical protein
VLPGDSVGSVRMKRGDVIVRGVGAVLLGVCGTGFPHSVAAWMSLAAGAPADARTDSAAITDEPGADATQVPEVVVTASPRPPPDDTVKPLIEIDAPEIESYGADSLSDLLDALAPRTESSRGTSKPLVLINGHLAGTTELANLPPEAVERVAILPEEAALAYGFPDTQRVVNIILKKHFRAGTGELAYSLSSDGEGEVGSADSSLSQINGESHETLRADYKDSERVLESERGIYSVDSADRTLVPESEETNVSGTAAGMLAQVFSSVEAATDLKSGDSLQGLAETSPAAILEQGSASDASHAAGQATGKVDRFTWIADGAYDRTAGHSLTDIGVNAANDLVADRSDSTSENGTVNLAVSGRLASLPAGSLMADVRLGTDLGRVATQALSPGSQADYGHFSNDVRRVSSGATLPLTRGGRCCVPWLGDMSLSLNAGAQEVTGYGGFTNVRYALNWKPVRKLQFNATLAESEAAPSEQQLYAPTIVTPNVEVFDFVTGDTDFVTQLTGGNPDLARTDNRTTGLGLTVGPFDGGTQFTANYEHSHITDAVGSLPPVTAAVEAAFPESFVRNADGTLIEVDQRPVNLALESSAYLRWGFYWPLPRANPNAAGSWTGLHFRLSAYDTWYFQDTILMREGLPMLDLLNGSPSSASGGQPHHKIELNAGLSDNGWGAQLTANWQSATEVGSGTASSPAALFFSSLATANLRIFADLAQMPACRELRWASGTRISLTLTNLLNSYQSVGNAEGVTPTAFLPGYLDPLGRVVTLSIRKII